MKNRIKNRLFLTAAGWKIGDKAGATGVEETECRKENLFHKGFKNFGRLDETSRSVCAAIALILHKRGLYPREETLNIPLILSSSEGPLSSDYAYFNDFAQFGEMAGRANLFVYTLPSSPLGEASVHFGLTGNLLFVNSDNPLEDICQMIQDHRTAEPSTDGYLAGFTEQTPTSLNSLFMFFEEKQEKNSNAISIEDAAALKWKELSYLKESLDQQFAN